MSKKKKTYKYKKGELWEIKPPKMFDSLKYVCKYKNWILSSDLSKESREGKKIMKNGMKSGKIKCYQNPSQKKTKKTTDYI